jgi:hypothetical protein
MIMPSIMRYKMMQWKVTFMKASNFDAMMQFSESFEITLM